MQVFLCERMEDNVAYLGREESHHLVNVLRLKTGSDIYITDGKGFIATAKVSLLSASSCTAEITGIMDDFEKRNYFLHIAVAPTKNIDRFEWFIEKATEIGIDRITPILCSRSERKIVNTERLRKLVISAAKQSMKSVFPEVMPLIGVQEIIHAADEGQKMIAHCITDKMPLLKDTYRKKSSAIILIGPEGDFTESEVQSAVQNDFMPVSLGNYRLRTETAALVACNTISILNQ